MTAICAWKGTLIDLEQKKTLKGEPSHNEGGGGGGGGVQSQI